MSGNSLLLPPEPLPLYPGEAPGLTEVDQQEVPTIIPFLLREPTCPGCVIVCPGGGYSCRAPHEADPIAQRFNAAGISACVCHYRVAPYRYPRPQQDAQRAIRWVRSQAAEWNLDPQQVAILGFSAGGHLVSTVGTHYDAGNPEADDPAERLSCRPDALILCYPVISFGQFRHTGTMKNLIGENPPEDLRQSLSNETQVTADTPPTFLWHTAEDGGVPVENSLLFAEALSRNKVPFELHVYPHGQHGLGLAPQFPHVATWAGLCCEWLHGMWDR